MIVESGLICHQQCHGSVLVGIAQSGLDRRGEVPVRAVEESPPIWAAVCVKAEGVWNSDLDMHERVRLAGRQHCGGRTHGVRHNQREGWRKQDSARQFAGLQPVGSRGLGAVIEVEVDEVFGPGIGSWSLVYGSIKDHADQGVDLILVAYGRKLSAPILRAVDTDIAHLVDEVQQVGADLGLGAGIRLVQGECALVVSSQPKARGVPLQGVNGSSRIQESGVAVLRVVVRIL